MCEAENEAPAVIKDKKNDISPMTFKCLVDRNFSHCLCLGPCCFTKTALGSCEDWVSTESYLGVFPCLVSSQNRRSYLYIQSRANALNQLKRFLVLFGFPRFFFFFDILQVYYHSFVFTHVILCDKKL